MASTVVHMALSGLIAAALLGDVFDRRALLVVLAVTAIPDLDSFFSLVSSLDHRAALHTLLIPLAGTVALWADLRRGEESSVRRRWGPRGVRLAWVSILVYAVSGIGLDLVAGAANPLWPLHDQYYHFGGKIELSSKRGIVQTFVDLGGSGDAGPRTHGSTETVHASTGVDPTDGPEPDDVDRVFPVVRSGWQLHLLLLGTAVTAARFVVDQTVVGDETE